MRKSSLFTSVLILSTFGSVACGSNSYPGGGDDGNSPPIGSDGDDHDSGSGDHDSGTVIGTPPDDAGVPVSCDVTATPAANACVVNETLGVFVAPSSATDAAAPDGTRARPYTSMQQGIDTAKAQKKRVYACVGTYAEQITLADGVSIFGDLDCAKNWDVVTGHAVLKAPASPAARADKITTATRVDSLDLIAPDATAAGGSSIGLIATSSTGLTFANATIHAGKGMKGADGVEGAELSNAASAPGADNQLSTLEDCTLTFGASCSARHAAAPRGGTNQCVGAPRPISGAPGGAGGVGIGDAVISGTSRVFQFGGQYYQFPTILANDGNPQPGNALTAAGGKRGNTVAAMGRDGASGSDGARGTSAAVGGTVSASGFVPADGTAGADGSPGQGGGGAAGFDYVAVPQTNFPVGHHIYFSNGPGGGAGGCPGLAGTPGKGGGASIGIIAIDSPLQLKTCSVQASDGGDGGKGTYASGPTTGGLGGTDYTAGTCTVCVFQPNGTNVPHLAGSGGTGGTAGLSGSGAGGSSIGIAYHGAIVVSDTTPTSGIAGHGVPASVSGPREDGPVTLPASADGQVAVTTTF